MPDNRSGVLAEPQYSTIQKVRAYYVFGVLMYLRYLVVPLMLGNLAEGFAPQVGVLAFHLGHVHLGAWLVGLLLTTLLWRVVDYFSGGLL